MQYEFEFEFIHFIWDPRCSRPRGTKFTAHFEDSHQVLQMVMGALWEVHGILDKGDYIDLGKEK